MPGRQTFKLLSWQVTAAAAVVLVAVLAGLALRSAPSAKAASDWYVDPAGNDANTCTLPGAIYACLTLQAAINKASAGDTVHVASGTYTVAGLVTVDKMLTLLGAQAGVGACGRAGAESILSDSQGMRIAASDVVLDGFTVQDSVNAAYTGYGVWMDPSVNVTGTHVVNNIFQDNIVGIGLANKGPSQALIQHNAFLHNNEPGGAFGTGIYTDQYVGGVVTNVLIDANCFEDNGNAGVGFSSTDNLYPDSNIEISNNTFDQNGRGVYFYSTNDSTVHDNCIKNSTVPTKPPGTSVAIGVFGDVNGLTILDNDLLTGAYRGIRVVNGNVNANSNVEAHGNNIVGFVHAGLEVDVGGHTGSVDATSNWWGKPTGPQHTSNPGGTGEVVIGDATVVPFVTFIPGGPCNIVGGIVVDPDTSALALDSESSSSANAWLMAEIMASTAAVAAALGGGVWYMRRRIQ